MADKGRERNLVQTGAGEYGRIWSEGSSLISEVDESSSYHVPGKHRSMNAHQVGRNAVNKI